MENIPVSEHYVFVLWDYDGAPDADDYLTRGMTEEERKHSIAPYYVRKKFVFDDFHRAQAILHSEINWGDNWDGDEKFEPVPRDAVGVALFTQEGVLVESFGMTFRMSETKFPKN